MTFKLFQNSINKYFSIFNWNKQGLDFILKKTWDLALENYSKSVIKYHQKDNCPIIDFNNLDQSVYLIYFASRFSYLNKNLSMARNFYFLNRKLNSIDIYFEVDLPVHTLFIHPLGTVLGRANYGDFLVVYQGVSVGSDLDGNFPILEGKNILFGHSTILGNSKLAENSSLSAGSYAYNLHIPENHYLRDSEPILVSPYKKKLIENFFRVE